MVEEIDPKTGLKIRKSTELRNSTAQEYQEAMIKRVEELSKGKDPIKSTSENLIVKSISSLLDLKIKLDDMLGENKDKIHKAFENILLTF
ncbi:MAG: hypothetical protein JW891_11770 [Candidatus Lokiarchaeota archaeon]|nr:hypothetical protein [Candidatus Lokiarchaeota archaeon]